MLVAMAQAAESGASASGGFFTEPENWVAIAFLIVAALLIRPAGRAIAGGLDAHRDRIKQRLDEAEKLHAEARELLDAQRKRQAEAAAEAGAMVAHARAEAQRMVEEGARDLDELLKRREQQALARIGQAEADALREVREAAVDLAIAAARKLLAEGLSQEQSDRLVERTIRDLGAGLH